MRRDPFLPAAAIAATFTTGLALVVLGPGGALYLAGSLIEAGWHVLICLVILAAILFVVAALAAELQPGPGA